MKLSLSHLNFSYAEQSSMLLSDFSLEANKGDIIALKGDSGTGKSTLFRLILGFETPQSGSIRFNDQLIQGKELRGFRNRVAWLPQDLDLGEGSLKEVFNFPFNFKSNQVKKPSQEEAEKVFRFLGLKEFSWNDNFKKFSTGQRQRIGIAICYFLDKEIMLLDEPTSALDKNSKEKIRKILFDRNKIIISSSHDDWWLNQCNKIIEIKPELKWKS